MATHVASALPLLKFQAAQQRLDNQSVQDYDQIGKAMVTLTGSTMAKTSNTSTDTTCEATVQVTFGSVFIEEPLFTFGSSVDQGSTTVAGSFPTLHAVIHSWDIDTTSSASPSGWATLPAKPFALYTGATIGVVATGQVGQTLWLHYKFSGRSQPFTDVPTSKASSGNSPASATNQQAPSTAQIAFGPAVSTLSGAQAVAVETSTPGVLPGPPDLS